MSFNRRHSQEGQLSAKDLQREEMKAQQQKWLAQMTAAQQSSQQQSQKAPLGPPEYSPLTPHQSTHHGNGPNGGARGLPSPGVGMIGGPPPPTRGSVTSASTNSLALTIPGSSSTSQVTDAPLPLAVLHAVKGNAQAEAYARKYFAARRKWKTVCEDLAMARAEMGEGQVSLSTHESLLQHLTSELNELQQRLVSLTMECQLVSQQLSEERQRYAGLQESVGIGEQRVQTLQGQGEQLGSDMQRARLILTELCPGVTPSMLDT